jgi:hypothetical protein
MEENAHGDVPDGLDVGDDVAHRSRRELRRLHPLQLEQPHLLDFVLLARVHQADALPRPDGAVGHPAEHHHPSIGVVLGVEDERLERGLGIPLGRRELVDDGLEQLVDSRSQLGGDRDRLEGIEPEVGVDLFSNPIDVRRGEVDLVDDREQGELVLHGHVEVGESLGFDALGRIDEDEGAVARHERPAHFMGEVDVAGGVDEVELIPFSVPGVVEKSDGVALDGDAPLALQVHRVENLVAELPLGHRPASLDQAVGECGLAVIDVGDDTKVADVLGGGHRCRTKLASLAQL